MPETLDPVMAVVLAVARGDTSRRIPNATWALREARRQRLVRQNELTVTCLGRERLEMAGLIDG